MSKDVHQQLNLFGNLSEQVNLTPSTGHVHYWSIYWTNKLDPFKECLECQFCDEIWPPKDQEFIRRHIAILIREIDTYAALSVKQPHRAETLKMASRRRYDKIAKLKTLLEKYGLDPDIPPQWEDKQTEESETVLGVNLLDELTPSTQLTPSTDELTPSTDTEVKEDKEDNERPYIRRRNRNSGGGYILKKTQSRRGKTLAQYWYCWEEAGGRKRSRYIARSLEAEIIEMNRDKRPVKEILAKLNAKQKD